jgi:hypothetical protein
MQQAQLCWIVPVNTGGYPAHPIAPGGPVPPVDPGYGYPQYPVDPGYGVPVRPGIWPGHGHPEHPIYWPPQPPGHPAHPIWGAPVDPGYGVPGGPPGSVWPGVPTHPIVIPNPPGPDYKPEHPIVLPPDAPVAPMNPAVMPLGTMQPTAAIPGTGSAWLLGNFPGYGWRWVVVDAGAGVQEPPAKPQTPPIRK